MSIHRGNTTQLQFSLSQRPIRRRACGVAGSGWLSILCGLAITTAASAQPSTKPSKQTVGTLGTQQMKGGDGLVGTTFTDGNGLVLNAKLIGAEYTVSRHNISHSTCVVPKVGEKLLILRWDVQNPLTVDQYINGQAFSFATVASDNQLRKNSEYYRLATAKDTLGNSIKPGQHLPAELIGVEVVPAAGAVPKLILNYGRKGTTEKVTRYIFGKAPNIIKALAEGDADPADPTRASAAEQVPAKIGVTYPLGFLDFTISDIAFVPGPLAKTNAGEGKRFLVVTFSVVNKSWGKQYENQFVASTLYTSDDEKTKAFLLLKSKRDEMAEGTMFEADDSGTYRMAFIVPNDTTGKKLTLAEKVDNSDHVSRALVFDLTGIK